VPIEVVHEYDGDGEYLGWYTESVPETYVKEEPDCFGCNDRGCPECDGSQIDTSQTFTAEELARTMGDSRWGGYSDVPPF
jgi:hypothetical protein